MGMQQLTLYVRVYGHANAPFAECFAEAEEAALVICAEVRDEEYWYAPKTYGACREKLDEGMRLLRVGETTSHFCFGATSDPLPAESWRVGETTSQR